MQKMDEVVIGTKYRLAHDIIIFFLLQVANDLVLNCKKRNTKNIGRGTLKFPFRQAAFDIHFSVVIIS
jgi:hypothetical protein